MFRDRVLFLGRTLRSLVVTPRDTWAWVWGAYLQFTPPVLWVSSGRRHAVATVTRLRDEDAYLRETCREITRDALRAELDNPRDPVVLIGLLRVVLDDHSPHRRRRVDRPPNRPN